jgi:hypothetical protein
MTGRWPLLRHGRTPTSTLLNIVKPWVVRLVPATCVDLHPLRSTSEGAQIGSCHGPAGGRRRGVGRAHPTGYTPPLGAAGRDNEIATKTQKLRSTLSVNTQPNHVLPLAHFGAISDVCDGGVVRSDRLPWCWRAGERSGSTQQHQHLEVHHASAGGWLVKPITGQAPPTAADIGVSKGKLHI